MAAIDVHLRFSPGFLRAALAAFLLSAGAAELGSENVTLSTYYPAPSGVYTQMITTQNAFLARDGGKVVVGGNVPGASKLTVVGNAQASDFLVGGESVVTEVLCSPDTGLKCVKNGNSLFITKDICVPDGSCSATVPACGQTTTGQDNCGNSCSKVGAACAVGGGGGGGLGGAGSCGGGWTHTGGGWVLIHCP